MRFVYHRRPPELRGTTLHPLNQLRAVHPDLYARQMAKYVGREELLASRIPPLDVLWNDVLHCAPIHPYLLYRGLRDVGIRPEEYSYFAIPVERLRGHRVALLAAQDPDRYESFDQTTYRELTQLPAHTLHHYAEQAQAGRRPLLYPGVPHVLVAGSINIIGCREIPWSTPYRDHTEA